MLSINPIYNINYAQAPVFKAKDVDKNTSSATNPVSQPNVAFKGTEALAAYNYNLVDRKNITGLKSKTKAQYIDDCKNVLLKRDLNNDGETSVEEVLQNNYFKISHPDFHEKDKVSLQKYAQKDGNSSVTAEEYAEWLNSEEHKEVLDDFRLIQAEEIKRKRNIN